MWFEKQMDTVARSERRCAEVEGPWPHTQTPLSEDKLHTHSRASSLSIDEVKTRGERRTRRPPAGPMPRPLTRPPLAGTSPGMRLSATAESGVPVLFGEASQFSTFSDERLFGLVGGSVVNVTFRDPTNPTAVASATERFVGRSVT